MGQEATGKDPGVKRKSRSELDRLARFRPGAASLVWLAGRGVRSYARRMPARERLLKPAVLAPAGSPAALDAALRAGADAVYLGVTDYNARSRATSFALDELPEVIAEAHRQGV